MNVLFAAGIPLDISLGALPFEARVIERASPYEPVDGAVVTTCSAEDLLVLTGFAGRPQDWLDIEGTLARQGNWLNRDLVVGELRPMLGLKEDAETESRLQTLFRKHPA